MYQIVMRTLLVIHDSRSLWKVNLAVIFIVRALKPKLLVKQVASSERILNAAIFLPRLFARLPRGSRGSWQLNRLTHFLFAVVLQCIASITAFCTPRIAPTCPTCVAGNRLNARDHASFRFPGRHRSPSGWLIHAPKIPWGLEFSFSEGVLWPPFFVSLSWKSKNYYNVQRNF